MNPIQVLKRRCAGTQTPAFSAAAPSSPIQRMGPVTEMVPEPEFTRRRHKRPVIEQLQWCAAGWPQRLGSWSVAAQALLARRSMVVLARRRRRC
jgi:hypothetical protein